MRGPCSSSCTAWLDLVLWDGLYHEMFNEPERETVFARMEEWLEKRVSSMGR
jgi:alpha-beta hydrolase superfamily lysophospholipase